MRIKEEEEFGVESLFKSGSRRKEQQSEEEGIQEKTFSPEFELPRVAATRNLTTQEQRNTIDRSEEMKSLGRKEKRRSGRRERHRSTSLAERGLMEQGGQEDSSSGGEGLQESGSIRMERRGEGRSIIAAS